MTPMASKLLIFALRCRNNVVLLNKFYTRAKKCGMHFISIVSNVYWPLSAPVMIEGSEGITKATLKLRTQILS